MTNDQMERLISQFGRIATALEALAKASGAEESTPDLDASLSDFHGYNWGAIGARIIASDEYGPTQVEHGGKVYNRRSPQNKFGEAIWFSRFLRKDGENNIYGRLITFKKGAEIDPLPPKTAQAIAVVSAPPKVENPTVDERGKLMELSMRLFTELGWTPKECSRYIQEHFQVPNRDKLTVDGLRKLCNKLDSVVRDIKHESQI